MDRYPSISFWILVITQIQRTVSATTNNTSLCCTSSQILVRCWYTGRLLRTGARCCLIRCSSDVSVVSLWTRVSSSSSSSSSLSSSLSSLTLSSRLRLRVSFVLFFFRFFFFFLLFLFVTLLSSSVVRLDATVSWSSIAMVTKMMPVSVAPFGMGAFG